MIGEVARFGRADKCVVTKEAERDRDGGTGRAERSAVYTTALIVYIDAPYTFLASTA